MVCKNWDEKVNKECKRCHKFLPLTEDFWRSSDIRLLYCIECRKEVSKQIDKKYKNSHKELDRQRKQNWRSKNRDKVLKSKRKYREKHPDKIKIEKQKHYSKPENKIKKKRQDRIYSQKNRKKINKKQRNWIKSKPELIMRHGISHMILEALHRAGSSKNGGSSFKHLPYTPIELKEHLEKQFEPWMNWSNYGIYRVATWDDNNSTTWTWQIDHIIPQSKLIYTSMEDENFKKCWALENLRPLSAKENLLKGNREIIDENTNNCGVSQ